MFYTPSAFHSKHVLKHLSDSHRLHISTRDAVCYLQQLEGVEGAGHHPNTLEVFWYFSAGYITYVLIPLGASSIALQSVNCIKKPTSVILRILNIDCNNSLPQCLTAVLEWKHAKSGLKEKRKRKVKALLQVKKAKQPPCLKKKRKISSTDQYKYLPDSAYLCFR